jgi:hypothetical protein
MYWAWRKRGYAIDYLEKTVNNRIKEEDMEKLLFRQS